MLKKYPKFFIFIPTVILVALAAGFLIIKNNGQGESLWRYVPEGSAVFVEFDLTDKKFDNYLKKNKEAKINLEKFLLDNQLPAEVWNSGVEIQRVALFVAFDETKILRRGWVVQSKNNISQLSAFLEDIYFKPINDRIAIVTKEKEMSEIIKQQVTFSGLDRQTKQKINNTFIYGFGQAALLFPSDEEANWEKFLADNFEIEKGGMIYWQGNINSDGQIEIAAETPFTLKSNWNELNSTRKEGNKYFDRALTIRTGGVQNIWPIIKSSLGEEGSEQKIIEEYINDKYRTEIKELYTIFEQPFDLIIRQKSPINNFDNLWQWDKNDCAMITMITEAQAREAAGRSWENFLINYLAFKFPEKRVKELPDKTKGYEIVIAPEKFKLISETQSGVEIKFVRAGDFELGYFVDGSQLVIFNSLDLAKQILTESQEQGLIGSSGQEDDMVADTKIFGFPYLDFAKWLGVGIKNQGSKVVFEGRLFD